MNTRYCFMEGDTAYEAFEKITKKNKKPLSLPQILHERINSTKDNLLWNKNILGFTEEISGKDSNLEWLIILHNTSLITSLDMRLKKQSDKNNRIEIKQKNFEQILTGILPNGNNIEIFDYSMQIPKDIKNEKYGIKIPRPLIKNIPIGLLYQKDFINPLTIARAGNDKDLLIEYFNLAKTGDKRVGNYHNYKNIDFNNPTSALLEIGKLHQGFMVHSKVSRPTIMIYNI